MATSHQLKVFPIINSIVLFAIGTAIGTYFSTIVEAVKMKPVILLYIVAGLIMLYFLISYFFQRVNKQLVSKTTNFVGVFITARGKRLIEAMDKIGVENIYEKLDESEATPANCVDKVKSCLYFLGGTASKWREAPTIGKLQELTKKNIEIKFLLFDPECAQKDEFARIRGKQPSMTYISELLEHTNRKIQIRFIDFIPHFRLTIINQDIMYLYDYDDHNQQYEFGKATPVVKLIKTPERKALIEAFQNYFDNAWNKAREIALS